MRTVFAILAAIAAIAILAPAGTPAAGESGAPAASAAKKCKKKKHFKSKKAKRRHRKRCKGSKGNGSTGGTGGGSGSGSNQACAGPGSPNTLGVRESEFSISFTRSPPLACGATKINQQNIGMDGHDLILQKAGDPSPSHFFPELAAGPGANATQTVDLSRGTWTFYCSLADHRAQGMERTVLVQ